MRTLLAIPAILFSVVAMAVVPLKSATWGNQQINCDGSDQLMWLGPNAAWNTNMVAPGSGPWNPANAVTVRRVCVSHFGSFTDGYAVSGHVGPNGDLVTPYVINKGTQCMTYDADAAVVVLPYEYFDVHASCNSGWHSVVLQIWYTQP